MGSEEIGRNMQAWAQRLMAAHKALGDRYAATMEADAKPNASWEDRTGHARQGIFGETAVFSDETLRVRVAHTMEYGVHLELANSGRYAILEPTVKKHAPDFFQDAERIVKGR